MNILMLNFNLKGVGTYQRSFYFGRELARYGYHVTMITVSPDSKYHARVYYKRSWIERANQPDDQSGWIRVVEAPNLGYRWLPGWGSGPLDILLRTKEIINRRYDVVYGFEYHPNVAWPVYLTKRWRSYRFFSDWCDWFAGQSNRMRGIKLLQKIDSWNEERIRFLAERVSVISKVLYQRAIQIGIPESRVVHIPQGAPTDYVVPLPTKDMRSRFGLPGDVPILLTGIDVDTEYSLLVFKQVLRYVPDTILIVLGKSPPAIVDRVQRMELNDHVHFTGWVSDEDYPCYISCADVCFLPLADTLLNRARFPAKILDYLSAGKPVVTNAVGEVSSLFLEKDIGVLVSHDIHLTAEAISNLLTDKERAAYLGERARELMVERWDWKIIGRQIVKVIENATS